jgi:hypothetical protein
LSDCRGSGEAVTQQPFDLAARARHPALYRADGASADRGGFFVSEAVGAYQHQRFTLLGRQSLESAPEIVEFQPSLLSGGLCINFKIGCFEWPHDGPVASKLVEIEISKDRKYPSLEIRPRRELAGRIQCSQNGILDQIIGSVAAPGQRACKGSQMGQTVQDVIIDAGAQDITVRSCKMRNLFSAWEPNKTREEA